ncbi:acyl-CoA desaturase [Aspergillus awamori]|uniref:stearoyl-CoA 9-desaturase n=1 Tax=Aspergillus awamori TaxID=105351 RepID=A0A401KR84_ASPAW|nr:acyl-CoA desaturase [Aspergillus awamori]
MPAETADTSQSRAVNVKRVHISEMALTWNNWHKHALWVPLQVKTAVWMILYYFFTGLGITAGYHRLWAHCSYSARLPLRIWLAAMGGVPSKVPSADPYSVRKGLLYSHIGWMVMKQNPKRRLFHGFRPTYARRWIWLERLVGGFIYAGILRIFFVQQATFCVNSIAHWLGEQPFDDQNSPRDHVITAMVTLGEGYHNFHHEFPSDYRNAIGMVPLGLAYDLKQFRANEIEKGRIQQLQKKLDQKRARLDWGVPLEQLPVMEWDDYIKLTQNGRGLVVIAGVVHDVTEFIKDHPGGKVMINSGIGKDATAMFNGGVYCHSNAAHNLLSTMRVGVIRGGSEVEIWKRAQKEGTAEYVRDGMGQRIIRAGEQVTKLPNPVPTADAA